MNFEVTLDDKALCALRQFANENDLPLGNAAAQAIEDWLVATGYLDTHLKFRKDSEAVGEA